MTTHRVRAVAVLFALLGATACAHVSGGDVAKSVLPDHDAGPGRDIPRSAPAPTVERPAATTQTLEKGPVHTNPFRDQVTYRTLTADLFGWHYFDYDPAFVGWRTPMALPPGLDPVVPVSLLVPGTAVDVGMVTVDGAWLTPDGRLVAGSMGNLAPWVFSPRPGARMTTRDGVPGLWLTVARAHWSPLAGWSHRVVVR